MNKKTLVLGASPNPERYSWKAVTALKKHGHEAIAVGNRAGEIDGQKIETGLPILENIDTVTLYLNEERQRDFYKYIFDQKPRRIIFNPGAENHELSALAHLKGIESVEGCTLVMLSIGNY